MPGGFTRSHKKYPNKPITKQPTINKPTIKDTITQGAAIGAGAAIGNTAVNGVLNTFSKATDTNNKCSELLKNFNNCMYSSNDVKLCQPYLDLLNNCISNSNN